MHNIETLAQKYVLKKNLRTPKLSSSLAKAALSQTNKRVKQTINFRKHFHKKFLSDCSINSFNYVPTSLYFCIG